MSDSPAVRAATVEGIGVFTFRKRNMAAEIKISVEFARITEGAPVDEFTAVFCRAIAELKVLTVTCPEGWVIEDMDPFDDDSYAKVFKVRGALLDGDGGTFRGKGEVGKGTGEGEGGDLRESVPDQVQPDGQ